MMYWQQGLAAMLIGYPIAYGLKLNFFGAAMLSCGLTMLFVYIMH